MLSLEKTNQFTKEYKLMQKRGKNINKLVEVLNLLVSQISLPIKYKDHKLTGNYEGSRELHIEPDWLLIYRINKQSLILERTGTHSDLFR
jgi:mRNA interferase YafQ